MNLSASDKIESALLSFEKEFLKQSKWRSRQTYFNETLLKSPSVSPSVAQLNQDCITIGSASDLSLQDHHRIKKVLSELSPWKKGPFSLFGHFIDTEWQCDRKWNRLKHDMSSLENRLVLDIGCGSGYYSFRMQANGAKFVYGVDPTLPFISQGRLFLKYLEKKKKMNIYLAACPYEKLLSFPEKFDTIFSMGIFYHRRRSLPHLSHLYYLLKPQGEVILETLIMDEKHTKNGLFIPQGRYAHMPNVFGIPSLSCIESSLRFYGFSSIKLVSLVKTSSLEQRKTPFMTRPSLKDFFHPLDNTQTSEGYPAPQRAIFIASK